MRKIHNHEFDEYLSHAVYIKYKGGYTIDGLTTIKELWNYKVKLIDSRNKNVFQPTTIDYTYSIKETELITNQQAYVENLSYVTKSLDNLIESLYDNIDNISEIKCSYIDLDDKPFFIIVKLENGCLHSLEGPAFLKVETSYGQYGIYGEMMEYEQWKCHPLVRKHKIEKIKYGQRNHKVLCGG